MPSDIFPRFLVPVCLSLLLCATLHAQTGTVAGRVVDSASGEPLSGATIRLMGASLGARQVGAIADRGGRFSIVNVPPGDYRVICTFLSFRAVERQVTVAENGTVRVEISMTRTVIGLGQVVVSASKLPEKATSAPASVTVVDAAAIEAQPVVAVVDHVRGVKGLDIVQSGISQNMVVSRGFNNAFSGTLTVLTDNRIASVPSLRFNAYNFIPLVNEDIQQIEVVRGPGSALYGPNTANGVLHILTRSPFSSTGTWLSAAVGERDLFQGMFRHAGTIGERLGYRVSGQYMTGEDWGYVDSSEAKSRADFLADPAHAGVIPDTLRIGLRDSSVRRVAGELRVDWLPTDDVSLVLSIGANDALRNPDITGVGGAQARDWIYTYYQLRATWNDLFAQVFFNKSDAGDSYLLRSGDPVVDRSSLFVTQLQHAWRPTDAVSCIYGADLLITTPVTDSTITGRNEGDDGIVEVGGYLQGDWRIVPNLLQGVAALRLDNHSRLTDPIVSPRAALVLTPTDDQTIRLTYNSAYSAPTTNDMFLDLLVTRTPAVDVRASGLSSSGFTFRLGDDGVPLVRSAFANDRNRYLTMSDLRGTEVWDNLIVLVNKTLRELGSTDTLKGIAPPPADLPLHIRTLNRETEAFDSSGYPSNVPPIKPTINQTVELGYQGVLFDKIILDVDLYRSHYTDFVGTLGTVTASVFYDLNGLERHLRSELIRTGYADSARAALYASILAPQIAGVAGDSALTGAPIATISPEQASDPTAVFFAPRNFGSITLYGVDLSLRAAVTPSLMVGLNVSYVDKNFLPNLDGVGDLALNAPKFKYTLSADYNDPSTGVNGGLLFRHVDGFPVSSGVFVGDVPGYSTIDLTLGHRLPWIEGVALSLSVRNLMTFVEGADESPFALRHAEFIGTPAIGRLGMLRATYEWK